MLNESEFAYTHDDYKQIIPAPNNMFVKYEEAIVPIVAIALTYDSDVIFLDVDSEGTISEIGKDVEIVDKDGNAVCKGNGE